MKFRPGDVCEILRGVYRVPPACEQYIGTECEILAYLGRKETATAITPSAYAVRFALNGSTGWVDETALRLKRPPSWDGWIFDTRDVEREYFAPGPVEHINCRCTVMST